MQASSVFHLSRFLHLLGVELNKQYKKALLIVGIVLVVVFLLTLFSWVVEKNTHPGGFVFFFLLIGGFVFVSLQFSELQNPFSRHFYITLPSSILEKYLCKWMVGGPIYLFFAWLIFLVYLPLSSELLSLFSNENYHYINFSEMNNGALGQARVVEERRLSFRLGAYELLSYFLFFQALLLLGGAYFKKFILAKVILLYTAFILSLSAVTEIGNLVICGNAPFSAAQSCSQTMTEFLNDRVSLNFRTIYNLVVLLLAGWLNFIAFTCLKEKQVH